MATIGSLIVELRANSAQFNAEMDKARSQMDNTGGTAKGLERTLINMGVKGLGGVVPGAEAATPALYKIVNALEKAKIAGMALTPVLVAIAAAFVAFKIGSLIGEYAAFGTTLENLKKQLEEAAKAQTELGARMEKERDTVRGLDKELAALHDNWEKVLKLEKSSRDADIIKNFGGADPRTPELLAKSEAIATEKRRQELEKQAAARNKFAEDSLKALLAEREAKFKIWQDETNEFVKQLQNRVQARKQFEGQFGQGGLPGLSSTKGVRESLDLQKDITKDLRDLAFGQREGFLNETEVQEGLQNIRERAVSAGQDIRDKFGGAFPAVDRALDKTLGNVTNLGRQFETARGFIDATVPTVGQLTEQLNQFNGMLANTPPATAAAQGAIAALSQQYRDLSTAVYESVQAVQAWQQAATQ